MNIEIKISKRRISYKKAMKILDKRVDRIKAKKGKELIWLLEHPVLHSGNSFNKNEILTKKLNNKTNRGGKYTT